MNNFDPDFSDLYDHDGVTENFNEIGYADGVEDSDYIVTGCDPSEYDEEPF